MYRDAKEELKRLEEALLREEEQPEEPECIETQDATRIFQWDPEDLKRTGRVYNSDKSDEELEEFSEAVYSGKKTSLTGWIITAVALVTGIVAVVIWWIVRYGGGIA